MTDLQKFLELYRSVGIEPEINPDQESDFSWVTPMVDRGTVLVLCGSTDANKTDGYMNFFTRIDFDKDGNFISQGFWE